LGKYIKKVIGNLVYREMFFTKKALAIVVLVQRTKSSCLFMYMM